MRKFLVFLSFVISLGTQAQKMEYGKISKSEVELKFVEFDPDADAVVLEEYSENDFYNFILHNFTHRRVKILKQSGTQHGTVAVRYFHGRSGIQTVNRFSARLVNFDGGKEKVYKLSKKDFFIVDAENGWKEVRFTFPEVKVGSIFEYKYKMQDRGISYLDGWVFQNKIPTLKSSYSIDIPAYLGYRILSQGVKVQKINPKQRDGKYKWALTDIKSIKEEPFMSNYVDYLEKIDFQRGGFVSENTSLKGGSKINDTYSNWQDLTDFLYEWDILSSFLKPSKTQIGGFYKSENGSESELIKAKEIYSLVQESLETSYWSAQYPLQDLKTTLEKKNGSRADINLTLLAIMRANELEA